MNYVMDIFYRLKKLSLHCCPVTVLYFYEQLLLYLCFSSRELNGNYSYLVDIFDILEQQFLLRASRPISNKTPYNLTKVYSPITTVLVNIAHM
jgi:hypothetical protein